MVAKLKVNILTVSIILIAIGIVMIYSSSSIYAWEKYGDGFYFLKRHICFLIIGIIFTLLAMSFDYRRLRRLSKPFLLFSVFLLVLVLIPGIGREVSGARRWFRFRFISFQPSEFTILAVIIYMADFICRKGNAIKEFSKGFLPPMFILGASILLILMQPDLGTSMSIGATVLIMLFVAGARLRYLLYLVLASFPALFILVFSVPYRRMRILSFLNPWIDPKGGGFQIIQSQIAIGSGGIFGLGLGHSKQKLFYLPAAHTDFIFSIIAEELGLWGTLGIIMLFIIFLYQGIKIMNRAPDRFGFSLALGLITIIALKAVINIGVSCGLFPTKGLPLPFISYGGSAFIFDMISVGILVNIARAGECP